MGTKQNQRFTLEPDPFFALGHPTAPALSGGMAFVQVCIFDSTNQGENDLNGFAFDYSMRKLVTN